MATGGLQGRQNLLQGVLSTTRAMKNAGREHVAMDAWAIATVGYEAIRVRILTVQSAINPDKRGRKVSHLMLDSVGLDVQDKGTTTTARIGWLHTQVPYFLIQEYGGEGYGSYAGLDIWGMESLRGGKDAMREETHKRGYEIQ